MPFAIPIKDDEIITLEDLLTSSGKYLDRAKHPECTEEVKGNGRRLLSKVNPFLKELGIKSAKVSSGFRTSAVNAGIANAAKKSLHMQGLAIDIVDADGKLDILIDSRDDLLKKYGLWQESPAATKSWCHLDLKDRGKRAKNQFIP